MGADQFVDQQASLRHTGDAYSRYFARIDLFQGFMDDTYYSGPHLFRVINYTTGFFLMRDGWGSSESNQFPGSGKNACLRVGGTQVDADNHDSSEENNSAGNIIGIFY